MLKNIQKTIFYTLVVVISIWYLFTEISLLYNSLTINKLKPDVTNIEKISFYKSDEYSLKFNVPQNVDIKNSYISISGSNYLTADSPEDYISFLDRIVVLETIPLNSPKIKKLSDTTYVYVDDAYTSEGMTSITELFLKDTDDTKYYAWQLASNSNGFWDFFVSRYSYLIQYLVWIYAIFGSVLTSKIFSTVYDSVTKRPLSGAIVRIFNNEGLVSTLITSSTGIIDQKLDSGSYHFEINKNGYSFPSSLKPLQIDGIYKNLYYGGDLIFRGNNKRVDINIPLDPINTNSKVSKSYFNLIDSTIETSNPLLLTILTFSQVLVWPNYFETYIYLGIGTTLLIMQKILKSRRLKKPGVVVDENNQVLEGIKLNLFDSEWNKLAESTQTNEKGEYEFIVLPNNYYLKIENNDYKFATNKEIFDIPKVKGEVMYINKKLRLVKLPTPGTTTTTTTTTSEANSTAS